MVHRRDVLLQQNDYEPKKSSEKQNDSSTIFQSSGCSEISSKQVPDAVSPPKSAKAKPTTARSTPSTPTRKGRQGSLDTTPPKISTRTVKRSVLRREISFTEESDVQSTQNGNDNQFPKPLRSGLLRASRLQSTSLIEISSIGRKRGRRKTLCNSLENVSTAHDANLFEKCNSSESLGQSSDLIVVEKLTCSLPLEKLSLGIVKSMMVSTGSTCSNLRNHFSDSDLTKDCMLSPASDLVGLSSPQATAKLLCLYCDKKFTSQKILCKHTERVHATDGRRLSSRNSLTSLSWPSLIAYPGCWICGNSGQKSTNASSAAGVVDDLKALFQHLIEVHSDKYYACTFCKLRFPNAETKEEHFKKKHAEGTNNSKDIVSTSSKLKSRTGGANVPPENISEPLHINIDSVDRTSPSEDNEIDHFAGKIFSAKTRRQLRQQAMQTRTTLVTRSCQNVLRNNEDTILTRLGVAQNRLPRGRKGTRNRRLVNAEIVKPEQISNPIARSRNKAGRVVVSGMKDVSEASQSKSSTSNRPETVSCTFDDDFYETVSVNVRQNLSCHLDGKLEGGPTSPSPISPVSTVPAVRSTVVRSPLNVDSEIHEATALAAVTAFPTLLTAEQYGSDWIAERKIKRPITKHSWKWKWDCVKKYKYVNEGGKIVKKVKQPMSGLRDLSKLDMWTQLTMRTKHEIARKQKVDVAGTSDILEVGEVAREEKRKQIAQLTTILDSRVFPQIVLEQTEQSLVKLEPHESETVDLEAQNASENSSLITTEDIPEILQLSRRSCDDTLRRKESLVLSGEWARPRCYICFSCGGRFDKLKTLEEHKVSRHPYIYSTHYEIVGRELLGDDLYKHLFIPVKALRRHLEYRQRIKDFKTETDPTGSSSGNGVNGEEESMDSVNSLTASSASANGAVTATTISTISSLEEHLILADAATVHMARRCTKCKRMCNGKLELYRHMLNCSGDYAWRIAQKRKYRYFGVKSRRNARQNLQRMRQVAKKIVKKELSDNAENGESSTKCNAVRTRPSDADTIRRMLENLPPKRACRQIIPNITKPRSRKFAKNLGLKKLVNSSCNKKMKSKAVTVTSTTLTAISSNMRRKQRLIARQITRRSGRMALRRRELKQNGSNTSKKITPLTEEQQQSESTANVLSNIEQSPNEKKSPGNDKKNKRGEAVSNDIIDTPDSPNQIIKTPKKKQSLRRSQEKSPKADEVPLQSTENMSNPKRDDQMFVENSTEISSIESSNPTEPLNLVVPPQQGRSPFLQVSPANKRQRGKKLTDCIAKLQEKLGKPFFEGNENLDTVLSARQQTPPQESSASTSCLNSPTTSNTVPAETIVKTPKRKTVTRKIIQKLSSDTIVSSKAVAPALEIKIESEEEFLKSKLTSKDQDLSVTSDMYDSLVESEKCDVPSRPVIAFKDSTLNELNDSAVSSMSTDSILINNITPEKHSEQIISKGFVATQPDSPFRKSPRKIEKCLTLPAKNTADDCDSDKVLNLSIGHQKNDPKEQSFLPISTDRALRKGRSGRTPPNSNKIEAIPIVEEALNLTVKKKRQHVTPAKASLQNEQIAANSNVFANFSPTLMSPVKENELVVPIIEERMNIFTDVCKGGDDVCPPTVPLKKEKKKPKCRKSPNADAKVDLSNLSLAQVFSPDPVALNATPKCPSGVEKQTNKPGRKGKTQSATPLFQNPEDANISKNTFTSTPIVVQNEIADAPTCLPTAALNASPAQGYRPGIEEIEQKIINESGMQSSNISIIKKGRGRRRKQDTQFTETKNETDQKNVIDHVVLENVKSILIAEEQVSAKNMKKGRNSKKDLKTLLTTTSNIMKSIHAPQSVDTVADTDLEVLKSPAPNSELENVNTKASHANETVDTAPKPRGKGRPRKKRQELLSPEVKNPTDLQQHLHQHVSPSEIFGIPALQPPKVSQGHKGGKNEIELIDSQTNAGNTLSENHNQNVEGKKSFNINSNNSPNGALFISQTEKQEPVRVPDETVELVTSPPNKQELEIETTALVFPAHGNPSTSSSSDNSTCKNSVFDTLRAVQENVFFNRNDNAGLTRKYSRKGGLTIKKAIIQPPAVPSTGSNKLNVDNLDKITLNDEKYIVSSLREKPNLETLFSKSIDRVTYKAPEPSKALICKRRSNRNKNNTKMTPDNSSICKELDDIVASFLQDDLVDTSAPKYFDKLDGPTRLINIESLLLKDPTDEPTSQVKNNDALAIVNIENNEKIDNINDPNDQISGNSLETKQINVSEKTVVCRELSIALTKMSDSEIQAKTEKAAKADEPEPPNKTLVNPETLESQPPLKTRSRRLSTKPEKVSLTDKFDDFQNIQLDMGATKSNENLKAPRKRKNTSNTNVDQVSCKSSAAVETTCSGSRIEQATQDVLSEAQKPYKTEIQVIAQSKISGAESTSDTPTLSTNETPMPDNSKTPSDSPVSKQSTTRRRRKNELAAIVADQLLESFKEVDKSRIDDLKKLENLAYEKSDDLYITGIRLTPLTKRKIVLEPKEDSNPPKDKPKTKTKQKKSATGNNDLEKEPNSVRLVADKEKLSAKTISNDKDKTRAGRENLFRNFVENKETPKLNVDPISMPKLGGRNFNLTFGTFRSYTTQEFTFGSQKEAALKYQFIPGSAETSCSVDSQGNRMQEDGSSKAPTESSNNKSSLHRKVKKKTSRYKKEKKAENENINELRSGLESFTFGKNTFHEFGKGLFGSIGFSGLFSSNKEKSKRNPIGSSSASYSEDIETTRHGKKDDESRKPFLRPSILSAVLSQESVVKKTSRDPRLNKSNVKLSNDELNSQSAEISDTFLKPKTRRGSKAKKNSKSIPPVKITQSINNTEDDDDHCLAAIAQSVNNRIMSEEEEFSQTDEFDVALPSEVTTSQLSLQTANAAFVSDDQRTSDVPNDDENTNTELIDMDLEDDVSIYTSFSQDVSSLAGKSRFGQRRRRRRSILMARRPKKTLPEPNLLDTSFDCTICNKTFAKAAALAKHQQTFTHVQKLSEYEYLNKLNEPKILELEYSESKPSQRKAVDTTPTDQQPVLLPPKQIPHASEANEIEHVDKPHSSIAIEKPELLASDNQPPIITDIRPASPRLRPAENLTSKISSAVPGEVETISSPEQVDAAYDRYQNSSSRIALSQEERLFYECCNMLKGSETPMVERAYPIVPNAYGTYDVPNKPVTPKSSERFSYLGSEATGNFQHSTAYTVKSPMSQSRTSPRYAYPKIDANQFSDISSDSNPAFSRTQVPHIALQPRPESIPMREMTTVSNKVPFYDQTAITSRIQSLSGDQLNHGPNHHPDGSPYYIAADDGARNLPLELSLAARVLTARTYIGEQRGKASNISAGVTGYSNVMMDAERSGVPTGSDQPLTSPLHSNSSQGSNNTNITSCRMRTKAAMKGYDNFKVSIPTTGLDMQQALERSPHAGCKLTALAEIALGSEAPITPPRYQPPASPAATRQDEVYEKHSSQQQKSKPDINEKFARKYQELIMNNIKPTTSKSVKKKEICDNSGIKLGTGHRTKRARGADKSTTEYSSSKENVKSAIICEKPPKDIYEFEESQEALDKDTHRGSPSKGRSSIVIPERPFKNIGSEEQNTIKFHKPNDAIIQNEESQMSSTSYSDRDDFNYGSMSEGHGEETDKEEEEAKSSDSDSCASAQTAKTHKCLIVGRIFGNANKSRPAESSEKPQQSVPEPKKKIPSEELNQMFDRLRKDGSRAVEERREGTDNPDQSQDTVGKRESKTTSTKYSKQTKVTTKSKKVPATKASAKPASSAGTSRRESERLSKAAEPELPRKYAKLQVELGMSAEEIAELIGEGKRKSQRKCAINRPRTVIDAWSSDEYEDFLATKDVIALIEEKEKKSKKKKPMTKNNSEKSMTATDPKESIKDNEVVAAVDQLNKRQVMDGKSSLKSTETTKKDIPEIAAVDKKEKKPQRVADRLLQRFNKPRSSRKPDQKQSKDTAQKLEPPTNSSSGKSAESKLSPSEHLTPVTANDVLPEENASTQKKQPTLSVKPRLKPRRHSDDSESDFENELRGRKTTCSKRPTSKISKRRKTIAFKEEHNAISSDSKYAPKPKQSAIPKAVEESPPALSKKSPDNSPSTVRPLARRKRVASEMLYYWSSSSSDEEFGRIETNEEDVTQKDEYLPKHGWIVGDSHKKLVTLLATAKGKKTTDLKEPGSKKKS